MYSFPASIYEPISDSNFYSISILDQEHHKFNLTHGMPQGLVLSPLLFNFYMRPLSKLIHCHGMKYQQYTYDTQLCEFCEHLILVSETVIIWMGNKTSIELWQDSMTLGCETYCILDYAIFNAELGHTAPNRPSAQLKSPPTFMDSAQGAGSNHE